MRFILTKANFLGFRIFFAKSFKESDFYALSISYISV